MIRVYVETNFLVELLRPLSGEEAQALFDRNGRDVQLVIPWCSFKEVERTLIDEVIDRDIGFSGNVGRVWASMRRQEPSVWQSHSEQVQEFLNAVRDLRSRAREGCVRQIEELSRQVEVIPPSGPAAQSAFAFSRTKRLKPFDEMIIGCVLVDAKIQATGKRATGAVPTPKTFVPVMRTILRAATRPRLRAILRDNSGLYLILQCLRERACAHDIRLTVGC